MKFLGTLAACCACTLALNAGLHAEDAALPANPYATVADRNVFNLVSPPPVVEPSPAPASPPVKITPNGIMSIFGELQVLFKVAGKTPGKEDSYILAEGQGQDGIEVTKINVKAGVVTFNNHGLVQEIPLVNAPSSSAPAFANPALSAMARGGNPGEMRIGNGFGNRPAAVSSNPSVPDTSTYLTAIPKHAVPMTPEEQAILNSIQQQ